MKPKPAIHPAARADQRSQWEYLQAAGCDPTALKNFIAAILEAYDKIQTNPGTWSFARGSKKVRKVQVPDFRMQVFYTIQRNGVPLIIEIAGPGLQPRWRERL